MKQKSGKLSHQLKAYSSPGISQRGQEAGRELEAGQTKVSQNLGPAWPPTSYLGAEYIPEYVPAQGIICIYKGNRNQRDGGAVHFGRGLRRTKYMTGQNRQERRWLPAVSLELKIIYIFKKGSRKLEEKNLDKTSLCTRLGSIQLNTKGRSQLGARLTIRPWTEGASKRHI